MKQRSAENLRVLNTGIRGFLKDAEVKINRIDGLGTFEKHFGEVRDRALEAIAEAADAIETKEWLTTCDYFAVIDEHNNILEIFKPQEGFDRLAGRGTWSRAAEPDAFSLRLRHSRAGSECQVRRLRSTQGSGAASSRVLSMRT